MGRQFALILVLMAQMNSSYGADCLHRAYELLEVQKSVLKLELESTRSASRNLEGASSAASARYHELDIARDRIATELLQVRWIRRRLDSWGIRNMEAQLSEIEHQLVPLRSARDQAIEAAAPTAAKLKELEARYESALSGALQPWLESVERNGFREMHGSNGFQFNPGERFALPDNSRKVRQMTREEYSRFQIHFKEWDKGSGQKGYTFYFTLAPGFEKDPFTLRVAGLIENLIRRELGQIMNTGPVEPMPTRFYVTTKGQRRVDTPLFLISDSTTYKRLIELLITQFGLSESALDHQTR